MVRHFSGPSLGPFANAIELMFPMSLERLDPVVDCSQLIGVQFVDAALPILAHGNQADLPEYSQVLRDGRLWHPESQDNCSDRQTASPRKQFDNLPPPRLRDGVKDVGSRGCSGHGGIIF